MPETVILAKSNADTSAALTAYTTPDSFTVAKKAGIASPVLARIDAPTVAHTAQDKGYVRIAKTADGTTRKIMTLPFLNTVGFAQGEATIEHGPSYFDCNMQLHENDVLDVDGQFEVASKDQGVLMHLVYGSNRPYNYYAQSKFPDHWVRHVTSAPTVDTWSLAAELNASDDGFDPNRRYALIEAYFEPGDTQGCIALRCYPKSDETWKYGFIPRRGGYKMLDCPVFQGNDNFIIQQYNGIATVVSNLFLHFKELP
jgi:hypothetical protein